MIGYKLKEIGRYWKIFELMGENKKKRGKASKFLEETGKLGRNGEKRREEKKESNREKKETVRKRKKQL